MEGPFQLRNISVTGNNLTQCAVDVGSQSCDCHGTDGLPSWKPGGEGGVCKGLPLSVCGNVTVRNAA